MPDIDNIIIFISRKNEKKICDSLFIFFVLRVYYKSKQIIYESQAEVDLFLVKI